MLKLILIIVIFGCSQKPIPKKEDICNGVLFYFNKKCFCLESGSYPGDTAEMIEVDLSKRLCKEYGCY